MDRTFKLVLIIGALLLLISPVSAWWDTDYLYRQEITISNPPSVSDFQAPFTITYDAHMDADFDDIRFVDGDDTTELDYWIESYVASTSATGYVELADTGSMIYLYYGKSGAVSASDGDATFDFFDDFPGSSLDGAKWTTDAGSPTVSGGILTINSGEKITGKTVFGGNYVLDSYAQFTEGGKSSLASIGFGDFYDSNSATITRYKGDTDTRVFSRKDGSQTEGSTIGAWSSQYYYFSTSRVSITDIIHTRDPGTSSTISTNVPTINLAPRVCSRTTYGGTAEVDWLLVRKYAATEPSFAYGEEEEGGGPSVVTFPGCSNPPTDTDADTLYDDINGNSRWDFNDIIVYFQNLAWCEANQPVELFDWNSNSRCDYDDVYNLWLEEGAI